MLDQIQALIAQKNICVLATSCDNQPHCSLMAYVADNRCREIYMVTHRHSQKFRNLSNNPNVSIMIDNRGEDKRVQTKALTVKGMYKTPAEINQKQKALQRIIDVHPHLKAFAMDPDAEIICIHIQSFLLLCGVADSFFIEI
jgi:nitroimidazol reductase NimA-like FMN-containing flavoprotein (pyridoxamine 5'-phosphate oxidase superfamily)